MGQSVIWYLPSGASVMQRIAFPAKITGRRGSKPRYQMTINQTVSGAETIVLYGGRSEVTIEHTFTRSGAVPGVGDALKRDLASLQAHLATGGTCMFAEDEDVAFAGFVTTSVDPDSTEFFVNVNLFENLVDAVDCSDREMAVNTDTDRYLYEELLCSQHDGAEHVQMTSGLRQNMEGGRWVMIREIGSWPALRVPAELREGLDIVPHERDWVFRFSLPLEEDPATLNALEASGNPLLAAEGSGQFPDEFDPDDVFLGIKDNFGWD